MSSTNHTLPGAAETYYQELLHGKPGRDGGLVSLHENLSGALSGMQGATQDQHPPGSNSENTTNNSVHSIGALRKVASLKRTVDYLQGIINRVNLFASHTGMVNLYPLLLAEQTEEEQWRAFLNSALRASVDADPYRKTLEQSRILADEIAITANKLADQISQLHTIELDNMPDEFFNLWHLLNETGEAQWTNIGFSNWCKEKEAVMGETLPWPEPPMQLEPIDHPSPAYDLIKDDLCKSLARIQNTSHPLEDSLSDLHSAWIAAPPVQAILGTLANSASSMCGSESGKTVASGNLREVSKKTEYLRSLAHLLKAEHQIPLSNNLKKAMAITATVIFSGQGIAVSYDDVSKALT